MIRALIGDNVFALCPQIVDGVVTPWRLVIRSERVLGKPITLSDVDTKQPICDAFIPDEMDECSDNFPLKITKFYAPL